MVENTIGVTSVVDELAVVKEVKVIKAAPIRPDNRSHSPGRRARRDEGRRARRDEGRRARRDEGYREALTAASARAWAAGRL